MCALQSVDIVLFVGFRGAFDFLCRIFVTLVWHVMYECMNEGMVALFISKTHATKLPRLGP